MRTTVTNAACVALSLLAGLSACNKPKTFTTTIEMERVQALGSGEQGPSVLDVEFGYAACPGHPQAIVRGDRAFAACAKGLKVGDRVPAEITFVYNAERGQYRSDVTKVAGCERKPDAKDDATYDLIRSCGDVTVHGLPMGVHCDKTRSPELVAKCPWFFRK